MRRARMIVCLTLVLILGVAGSAYAGITTDGAGQRTDEVLLEGEVLEQVVTAALAEVGADATVIRAETDADGNAPYEVHLVTADGVALIVYVDESYGVVGTEGQGGGRLGDGDRDRDRQHDVEHGEDQKRTRDEERTRTQDEHHHHDGGSHDRDGSRDGGH